MKKKIFVLWLLGAAIFSSCKKDGKGGLEVKVAITAVGTNDGTPVTKTIGAGGGAITSTDGQVEVVIPAGALGANTDITIQPITNTAPNGRGKAYRLTPDGLQFSKDIAIKFHYTAEEAAMTKPEYMRAAFQTASGAWQPVEKITNDASAKTVTASVNHFTDFGQFDVLRLIPAEAYVKPGATANFEISYVGMSSENLNQLGIEIINQEVTWKVNSVTGGDATNGTISPTTRIGAKYTAPASSPAVNPVVVSVELDIPFVIDGQRFLKGILTANAYIIGAKYSVLIESTVDITIGTGEKFRIRDNVSFEVNIVGFTATITNLQNTGATIHKIANSPVDCSTTIESSGTGGIHLLDHDVTTIYNPIDREVYLSINPTGAIKHPIATTACGGGTPGTNELVAPNGVPGIIEFLDNAQQQTHTETTPIHTLKYTITPLP